MSGRVGVVVNAFNAAEAVQRIAQAEAAGVPHAWMTTGGTAPDALTVFAAAAVRSEQITLGTCIIPTWPRHPIALAQQVVAIESLAPGRIRLGIGPSHEGGMTSMFGVEWRKPLTQLREYLLVLRALLHDGSVDFAGEHVTARAQLASPPRTPLLASALRPASFEVCGELADGAISWQCPAAYLLEQALPALVRGAARAGRPVPPLFAHVPVAITTDRAELRSAAERQLGGYSSAPFYRAMYEQAGVPQEAGSVGDELLDGLVVWGDEASVADRLVELVRAGMGELLVQPLVTGREREASVERVYRVAAEAARRTA
jgi:F420-dependent oxidoreductase-like protein